MIKIKPLDEITRYRVEIAKKQKQLDDCGVAQLVVGMDRCGIAAGSQKTLQAILSYAMDKNLNKVVVVSGGCVGHCEHEPIVQLRFDNGPFMIYGRVTPEVAYRILEEHVCGGKVVRDYIIET